MCRQCHRAKMAANARCTLCTQPVLGDHRRCEKCMDTEAKRSNAYRLALKFEAYNHYGHSCVFCGDDRSIFLTLDHVANDGAAHRRIIKCDIYKWAKRNHYPPVLQTLCFNCNCAKACHGEEIVRRVIKETNGKRPHNIGNSPESVVPT
jgi:hypothetical protein